MSNNEGVFTNAVTTVYDAEGHVVSQRGATYPVDYAYDEFGEKISMTTYRDINAAGDVTRWLRDEATGLVTNKVYADGKGPRYDYTPDGKLATRTWARGIVTTYSYDDGALTNTVYSDGTPTISLAYNRAGRQIQAIDAAGVTTFLYDGFGAVTNETVVGVAGTNTIIRHWDNYGRSLGYALNGARQSTLAYDPATGRLASMQVPSEQSNNPNNQTIKQFSWNYLAGSDLKSSLAYPNGLTASWQYDANGQLLQVCNATPTNAISQYDYAYDAAGRRVQITRSGSAMSETRTDVYGYNIRSELISAAKLVGGDDLGAPQTAMTEYAYEYDDIGNRITSLDLGTNRTYVANNLNQYTQISNLCDSLPAVALAEAGAGEVFHPQFDDDGNQTLIQTATGVWQVQYNGENRPTLWSRVQLNNSNNTNNQTIILMSYDRMGRRVQHLETCGNATNENKVFIYDGYLQVANFDFATQNAQRFAWDPTEPIATRPLVWNSASISSYYTHDGNKNVSDVVSSVNEIGAHYEYTLFGALTSSVGDSASQNMWRFSSEYADDDIGIAYYNYRHYITNDGRWMRRDMVVDPTCNEYLYIDNDCNDIDILGLERKERWEAYWKRLSSRLKEKGYGDTQRLWAKWELARGCIGVVTSRLGDLEKLDDCYKSLELAILRRDSMAQKGDCKNSKGCPLIYSIHFWNGIGKDRKHPDVTFDSSGKANMNNWDREARGADYVNFDFGFFRESSGEMIHADQYHNPDKDGDGKGDYWPRHEPREATIIYSSMDEWAESYDDFNAEVWCVQCSKRGIYYAR